MTINLKVPSMVCDGCVSSIETAILTHEPEAKVSINLDTKEVTVDTEASETSIKQIITAAGYEVE
ncbi:heavy-metal-associated domain-containing protein [Waterburya agarophytonicola K14]|uniref:Heavy-metal-associated domain-containing protein n=1 Tax=Waterburya agarophytonicola KI4 TaxID=2874699 RepID=A0A964BTD7_9CYAN|nr:heavy metal-associated domain-containing protein [Waterburya agarophytonicola]MCC0179313.1 heavy-metal-associated domain-containing protein [Waterburya agarophytonicola KI4]